LVINYIPCVAGGVRIERALCANYSININGKKKLISYLKMFSIERCNENKT